MSFGHSALGTVAHGGLISSRAPVLPFVPPELVNDAVLIPHAANWRERPQWKRRWETGVEPGVTGAEDRTGMRRTGLRSLTYLVTPANLQERARLSDRIRAALAKGRACVPYWGRGSLMASVAVGTSAIVLAPDTAYPWRAGEVVFLQDQTLHGEEAWEVHTVLDYASPTLILATSPEREFSNGTLCWPLLFGTLSATELSGLTNHHGEITLTLTEPLGQGTLGVSSCPVPNCPEPYFGGENYGEPENPIQFMSDNPTAEIWNSSYVWGFSSDANPNAVIEATQMICYRSLADIEFADEVTSPSRKSQPFWQYKSVTMDALSMFAKHAAGSCDPLSATGDSVIAFTGYWTLSFAYV